MGQGTRRVPRLHNGKVPEWRAEYDRYNDRPVEPGVDE